MVVGPSLVGLGRSGEDAIAFRTLQDDRLRFVGEDTGLDRDARIGEEIVVPVRVRRCAGARSDDQHAFAALVMRVADRGRVGRAGLGSGGGEEEQPGVLERAADLPSVGAEFLDDLLVEIDGHTWVLQG